MERTSMKRSALPILPLLVLVGCTGSGDLAVHLGKHAAPEASSPGTGPLRTALAFSCDPALLPSEVPLRRLSRVQFIQSIESLVWSTGLSNADKSAVLIALSEDHERFPEDRPAGEPGDKHGGFKQLDHAVQQGHVDVSYEVAVALGQHLTSNSARLSAVMGSCAVDNNGGNDSACLSSSSAASAASPFAGRSRMTTSRSMWRQRVPRRSLRLPSQTSSACS